ncbi:hypothetical protein U0070_006982, partial [Myodes glareolus]
NTNLVFGGKENSGDYEKTFSDYGLCYYFLHGEEEYDLFENRKKESTEFRFEISPRKHNLCVVMEPIVLQLKEFEGKILVSVTKKGLNISDAKAKSSRKRKQQNLKTSAKL